MESPAQLHLPMPELLRVPQDILQYILKLFGFGGV
jgi:hypothetical protein